MTQQPQPKKQLFEIEFYSKGLEKIGKDLINGKKNTDNLSDSVDKFSTKMEKSSKWINETNELFRDRNSLLKVFKNNNELSQKEVQLLGDTISKVNKLQTTNITLAEKENISSAEALRLESELSKERRKAKAEEAQWIDAITNTLERGAGQVADWFSQAFDIAEDTYDSASDFYKAAKEDAEEYISILDNTTHYSKQALKEHNENVKRAWEEDYKTMKAEEAMRSRIINNEKVALNEIEENRQNALAVNKAEYENISKWYTMFKSSPYLNRLRYIEKNNESNEAFDKQITKIKDQTKKELQTFDEIQIKYLESLANYVAESNGIVVTGDIQYIPKSNQTTNKKKQENKDIEDDKDEKEQQLRQQRGQSNLQLDEQAFFHERSLLETASFNDRQNELLDEAQQSMSNFVQANQEAGDAIVETAADTQESHKEHWSKISATMQEHVDIIMTGVNAIFSASNALLSEQLEEANEKFEAISEKYSEAVELRQESSDKISSLEEQSKNARGGRLLILQEQINQEMAKNQQLAQQEKQLAKEKEKAEKEKEKKEKQIKKNEISQGIIQGVANTALGVTKAWSLGPIIGPIMAAIVGAAGAIQVGVMTKQLSKLEDGGFLKGKRHSQGGMRIEGTNIEVEGGEYVINRESTSKNLGLVRYINSQRKELNATDMTGFFAKASQGFELPFQREFAAGGLMPAIETPSTIDNEALIDAIKSIKINSRVAVTDIIRAQEDAVQVDRWSGN